MAMAFRRSAMTNGRDPFAVTGTPPIAPTMGNIDIGPIPQVDPTFFGRGGQGRHIAGILGDALSGLAGQPGQYAASQMREREQQQELARQMQILRAKQEADATTPQAVNLGGGGFGTWSPSAGLEVVREPTQAEGPSSESERLIALATDPNTPPEQAMLARQALRGSYTPAMQQQQADRVALKTTPTYAATHPKPAAPRYEYRMGPNGQLQRRQVN